jgi:hypothetical protein
MMRTAMAIEPVALWSWDFSPIAERALLEHPELAANYSNYELELRKFFALIVSYDQPIAMISPRIDCLWHALITFTPLYREFCSRVFGFYVDHVPRTARTQIPEKAIWNFFDRYEYRFGDVPCAWFDGLSVQDTEELRNRRLPSALLWSGWVPHLTAVMTVPQQR